MAREGADSLHLFCRCGQKMKVTAPMFGRPAKCVGCGLKIRIPTRQELGDSISEIHIDDRPDLVRGRSRSGRERHKSAERRNDGPAAVDSKTPAPLDVLEPLRILCSLDKKIDWLLGEADAEQAATFERHRVWLKQARAAFEEDLRQRLMETAVELASTQQKLSEAGLSVRVGECTFAEFRAQAERLRRRRDRLEQRQANLRAWMAVRDPYIAGGYVDLPLKRPDDEQLRVLLHDEPDESTSLVEWEFARLREAMLERQEAERNRAELRGMQERREISDAHAARAAEGYKAARRRAEAARAFWQARLEQTRKDLASDLEALDAQLELGRGRRQLGELDRSQFEALERELLQARADLLKAVDVASRALSANSARDLPALRGTFLARLMPTAQNGEPPVEKWLLWAGVFFTALSLFLPLAGSYSPLDAALEFGQERPGVYWLFFVPMAAALLFAVGQYVPRPERRGALLLATATVAIVAAAAFLHEAWYGADRLGEHLRGGLPWPLRFAGLSYLAGMAAAVTSAWMTLALRRSPLQYGIPAALVAVVLGVLVVQTEYLGLYTLRAPVLDLQREEPAEVTGRQPVRIALANPGGRAIRLVNPPSSPTEFGYRLQRQIGQQSWHPVEPPNEMRDGEERLAVERSRFPDMTLEAGRQVEMWYALEPGRYRVQVLAMGDSEGHPQVFEVEGEAPLPVPPPMVAPAPPQPAVTPPPPPAAPDTPPAEEDTDAAAQPDAAAAETAGLVAGDRVDVELRGIASAVDLDPRFSLNVYMPDGQVNTRNIGVGGRVFGEWRIREYNPVEQTLTLHNGERILILRSGRREELQTF